LSKSCQLDRFGPRKCLNVWMRRTLRSEEQARVGRGGGHCARRVRRFLTDMLVRWHASLAAFTRSERNP
jgi:hypothetical protein